MDTTTNYCMKFALNWALGNIMEKNRYMKAAKATMAKMKKKKGKKKEPKKAASKGGY